MSVAAHESEPRLGVSSLRPWLDTCCATVARRVELTRQQRETRGTADGCAASTWGLPAQTRAGARRDRHHDREVQGGADRDVSQRGGERGDGWWPRRHSFGGGRADRADVVADR